jgi:hypothetical protein
VVIATTSVCLAVATLMVSVRLYTRWFLVRQVGLDDYLATITLVLIYGVGIGMALNTTNGLGKHMSSLDDEEVFFYKRSFYASIILYTTALLAVKTTLLTQYYRLFSVQSMRSLYLTAFVLVVTWSVSQVFLAAFACMPVSAFWDTTASGAKCLPTLPLLYSNAAGNIATEVAVLALPLPVLGSLNLPRSQRMMLIGVFSLGFVTVIISIIRIRYLNKLSDYTYQTVPPACLSLAELTTALTCACLLTLRPIITRTGPSASQLVHEHKRGSYFRQSESSNFVRSSSYSSSQTQQAPRRGSAAVRYLATMQSREGLYDDKYMLTASSYELEHYPSETQTPQAAVIAHEKQHQRRLSRDMADTIVTITAPKTQRKKTLGKSNVKDCFTRSSGSKEKKKSAAKEEWSTDSTTNGIGSSVTTEIDNRGAKVNPQGKPTPKWEIGVETTVYQSYQSTYMSTAVRC